MKLQFLGTRGNIEARTTAHFRHTAIALSHRGRRVFIDCGADWIDEALDWRAEAILITHGHPDHVDGLKHGAPCPVYATRATWKLIGAFPTRERLTVVPRREIEIAGMTFVAFRLEHSLRAPAVGYRISAGDTSIFYCPDVVSIHGRRMALAGISAYIGDGACLSGSLVHRRGTRLIGHVPIETQLAWCRAAGVPKAIITHCGTQIVTAEEAVLRERIAALSREYDMAVAIAEDGMELTLGERRRDRDGAPPSKCAR
jgi:phosphoribosyl 1,2-cyclic phosphodiesterase